MIRRAHGGKDGDARFERGREAADQAAAEALGAAEAVDHEQVDALGDCCQEGRLGIDEAALAKLR
jgi:hypothetical protein